MANGISSESNLKISYTDPANAALRTRWKVFMGPSETIQRAMRNSFPLLRENENKFSPALNRNLSKRVVYNWSDSEAILEKKLGALLEKFKNTDIDVEIKGPAGSIDRTFKVRSFISKDLIRGKQLRVLLFDFSNNTEGGSSSEVPWNPTTVAELSKSPISVLKALDDRGVRIDSLVSHSALGNIALDGLPTTPDDAKKIPPALVINADLKTVKQVANSKFFLNGAAKLFGCVPDPENKLVDFLKTSPNRHTVLRVEKKGTDETISSVNAEAIAREIFFDGTAVRHTSYCIGRPGATQSETMKELVIPVLSGFIAEKQDPTLKEEGYERENPRLCKVGSPKIASLRAREIEEEKEANPL